MRQFVSQFFPQLLLVVFTLLSISSLSAQSGGAPLNFEEKCILEHSDYYNPYSPATGQTVSESNPKEMIAFSHLAPIRKKATTDADIVSRVPMGETVQVTAILETVSTVEGVTAPWCEVKYKNKKGFMWTGALTAGTIKLSDNSFVCWGIARIVINEEEDKCVVSVRRYKDGLQLQRLEVNLSGVVADHSGQLELWCAPNLDNVKNVIELATYSEDQENVSISYFTWDGTNVKFIQSGYASGDGTAEIDSKMVIFPYPDFVSTEKATGEEPHTYPRYNQIMVKESYGQMDEDCVWDEHIKVKFLAWPSLLPTGCE